MEALSLLRMHQPLTRTPGSREWLESPVGEAMKRLAREVRLGRSPNRSHAMPRERTSPPASPGPLAAARDRYGRPVLDPAPPSIDPWSPPRGPRPLTVTERERATRQYWQVVASTHPRPHHTT